MDYYTTAGYGDSVTWGGRTPPEEDSTETWYEKAGRLLDEIKAHADRAATAAFRRDQEAYRLAMLNLHELSGSLWDEQT